MSDNDHNNSDKDALIVGHQPGFKRQWALARAKKIANKTLNVVQKTAKTHIEPRLEEFVDKWTQPEHVETLQTLFATTAQWGFKFGFANDPKAKLLFDFASYIEDEHGRASVLSALTQFNPVLDGSLVELIQARYATWPKINRTIYDTKLHQVRVSFLHLICALARLEEPPNSDRRLATGATVDEQVEFFHECLIPQQFKILADLAAGDESAYKTFDEEREHEETKSSSFLSKLKTALITPDVAEEPQDSTSTALASEDLTPFQNDPKFQFLVNSYTFFIQTYATRAVIESFPELIGWAKQMDAQVKQHPVEPEEAPTAPVPDGEIIDV